MVEDGGPAGLRSEANMASEEDVFFPNFQRHDQRDLTWIKDLFR